MPELLDALRPAADDLSWQILDLGDVVAGGRRHRRLRARAAGLRSADRPRAVVPELAAFARDMVQVIDGLFVGCASGAPAPQRHDGDLAILARAEIVLAAFDSSSWLVSAPDDVLERVAGRFAVVSEEDPATTPLRAWGPTP